MFRLSITALVFLLAIWSGHCKGPRLSAVKELSDMKEFKKLIRTKTNVLVAFIASPKSTQPILKVIREAAEIVKGLGTMVVVDCSTSEGRKLCKKLKVTPELHVLRHYKDGEYHKEYDRREVTQSMVNFMRDPGGDVPWEEEDENGHVVHLPDPPSTLSEDDKIAVAEMRCKVPSLSVEKSLIRLLKKDSRPTLVMFYAPWCGFCKQLKPEYAAAASEVKDFAVMAAIDVNRPENAVIRTRYNITGFPTLLYFENGELKQTYEGDNKRDKLVAFLRDPTAVPVKPKEVDWAETSRDVVHLTADSFDDYIKTEPSVLVMFYAPWCGHCNKMKPDYEKAAIQLKKEMIRGSLAAVDATKESALASRYGVRGYPTLKYFKDGELAFDAGSLREQDKLVQLMRDPKQPPPPPLPEPKWAFQSAEVGMLDGDNFQLMLKKRRHALVMFYAPWCGHCKSAKPEFSAAAEELKDDHRYMLGAVDCTDKKNIDVCQSNQIKGYPTIKYFHYFNKAEPTLYTGPRTKTEFVAYLRSSGGNTVMKTMESIASSSSKSDGGEESGAGTWPEGEGSDKIIHLNDNNFDKALANNKKMLVMFYAPWCGHCNAMKPIYSRVASRMPAEHGVIAACDATIAINLSEQFNIQGFPTLKYFSGGRFVVNYSGKRTLQDLLDFMKHQAESKDEL